VVDTLPSYRRLSLVVVGSAPRRWLEFEYEPSCARIRSCRSRSASCPLLLPLLLLLPGLPLSLLSPPLCDQSTRGLGQETPLIDHHNTTTSSFIVISPSVLSCVHGPIDSDSSAPPFLVHPRAQANSAVPPRSYLLLRTTFNTSSTSTHKLLRYT
jgi:hypothetical protein